MTQEEEGQGQWGNCHRAVQSPSGQKWGTRRVQGPEAAHPWVPPTGLRRAACGSGRVWAPRRESPVDEQLLKGKPRLPQKVHFSCLARTFFLMPGRLRIKYANDE